MGHASRPNIIRAGGAHAAPPAATATGRRRRGLIALFLAALVIVGVGSWLLFVRDGEPSPGPLETRSTDSVAFGQPAGVPFGWGVPVVFNTGAQAAVLDRVTVLDAAPGLRVLEASIGGPDRKYLFYSESYQWPDPERFTDLHPVRGMRVPPADTKPGERGVELVFAMRADKPGQYRATRIAVEYRIGDTRHRVIVRSGLNVCVTPRGQARNRNCPFVRPT